MVLVKGLRGALFLMGKAPLQYGGGKVERVRTERRTSPSRAITSTVSGVRDSSAISSTVFGVRGTRAISSTVFGVRGRGD